MKTQAAFNLKQMAKEQYHQAQQFMTDAFEALGKADQTMHEPGDTHCRTHLASARRNIASAEACMRRCARSVAKIEEIRPYPDETPHLDRASRPEAAPRERASPLTLVEAPADRRDASQVCTFPGPSGDSPPLNPDGSTAA